MLNYSWSKDYSVNDPVIDDHHKNLLQLFNKAYTLLVKDAPSDETKLLLKELKTYSIFHFREEEQRMSANNYDGFEEHHKKHQYFISEVDKFSDKLETNTRELNEEIFIFLSGWLTEHIQKVDKLYMGKI